MNVRKSALLASAAGLITFNAFAAGGPGVEPTTQAFLQALEAGGGKPLEQMTPVDARAVLVGAQSGVKLTLPKADVSEKIISVNGSDIKLTIVRPAGITKGLVSKICGRAQALEVAQVHDITRFP